MIAGQQPAPENKPTLALVGATGVVGTVTRQVLSTRENIWGRVRLFASAHSSGRRVPVLGDELEVDVLTPHAFDGVDVALFNAPEEVARTWAPVAAERGATVVDGSPAFRMDHQVPLVVAEVNAHAARSRPRGIVASPSCATMGPILAVGALHAELALREFGLATYQAASGAGQSGVETLYDQISAVAGDRRLGAAPGDVRRAIGGELGPFPAPLALNVVPWVGTDLAGGWTSEERGVRDESRKILDLPDLKVSTTCVQVPVISGHSAVVHAVFESEVDPGRAAAILRDAPGVVLYDDPASHEYPTPADVVGTDPVWVGRLRQSLDEPRALDMFVSGDNLRKGAALNAVQIAELVATT